MNHLFYRAEPVHEDIYIVVGQATHDGPLYEVDQCRGWHAACAIIDRLNATADGLHRIGVAVAVWAGMATAYRRGVAEADRAQRMHRIALDLAAELHAERAARRKRDALLRARAERWNKPAWEQDALLWRARKLAHGEAPGQTWLWWQMRIAGPRGVLP